MFEMAHNISFMRDITHLSFFFFEFSMSMCVCERVCLCMFDYEFNGVRGFDLLKRYGGIVTVPERA